MLKGNTQYVGGRLCKAMGVFSDMYLNTDFGKIKKFYKMRI